MVVVVVAVFVVVGVVVQDCLRIFSFTIDILVVIVVGKTVIISPNDMLQSGRKSEEGRSSGNRRSRRNFIVV